MKNNAQNNQMKDNIWGICNLLRGNYKRNEYRKVILPLVVLTRFDIVLKQTKDKVLEEYNKIKAKPEKIIQSRLYSITENEFYNISKMTINKLLDDPNQIAQNLNGYIYGFSPNVREIINRFRFAEQIERMDEKNILYNVIRRFVALQNEISKLGNEDMGYIFEEIIRIGAEQANEEAGEHFTPREIIKLMVYILLSPSNRLDLDSKVKKFYDPACGTGGMLSMGEEYIKGLNANVKTMLYGQDMNDEAWAICKSDMLIKGNTDAQIVLGDTFRKDGFKEEKFDYMLANPPFGVSWENQKKFIMNERETLGFDGRFGAGKPRINDGSFLFLQHMISKMYKPENNDGEGSRIAIIFNGSPLFNGDAGGGESEIRRWIIENDYLEAIIALPDSLFYNTGIHTYLWILSNNKEEKRKGKVQLIDARKFWAKMLPKSLNYKRKRIPNGDGKSPGDYISAITEIYDNFKHDEIKEVENPDDGKTEAVVSKIFPNEHFAYLKIAIDRPLRLNFCVNDERIERLKDDVKFLSLVKSKKKNRTERLEEIKVKEKRQEEIISFLKEFSVESDGKLYKDRKKFLADLRSFDYKKGIKFNSVEIKAVLSGVSKRDETAEPCTISKGRVEADSSFNDVEQVPVDYKIDGYKAINDQNKPGAISNIPYSDEELETMRATINRYFAEEVTPHVKDAWVDYSKTKIGYEIMLTKEFFVFEAPRDIELINAEIEAIEKDISAML